MPWVTASWQVKQAWLAALAFAALAGVLAAGGLAPQAAVADSSKSVKKMKACLIKTSPLCISRIAEDVLPRRKGMIGKFMVLLIGRWPSQISLRRSFGQLPYALGKKRSELEFYFRMQLLASSILYVAIN
jgi:hypothetical protein